MWSRIPTGTGSGICPLRSPGRLVEHMDRVLEQLASGGCACYHLDGQAIALDDYLEIRPEKRELVEKYVRSGRLKAGRGMCCRTSISPAARPTFATCTGA